MSGVYFEESPDLRREAGMIIQEHHEQLKDAEDQIGFWLRHGTWKKAGTCKKASAFERQMTGRNLLVFINADAWKGLAPAARKALIDHELSHIVRATRDVFNPRTGQIETKYEDKNSPDSWGLKDHDMEEFAEIIERHGLWETGVRVFAEAIEVAKEKFPRQFTLADFDPEDLGEERVVPFRRSAR